MFKDILIKNEGRLFLGLIALHIIPIWFFNNFSTVDGWTHTYNTFLLNEYFFGHFENFSHIYQVNPSYYDPNWFINIFQLIIAKIFSFWANDKVILSLYIILFPLSLRYAIRAINKEAGFIAILSIPLIYSMAMFLGFFGYLLSLPLAFILTGYFIRHTAQWNKKSIIVFALGSILLYLFHIVGFGLTFIALGLFNLTYIIHESIQSTSPIKFFYNKNTLKNRLILPLLAISPTLILIFFFLDQRPPSTGAELEPFYFLARLKELFLLYLYLPFTNKAGLFSIPLSLMMLTLLVYYLRKKIKDRNWVILDILFIIFIIELVLYLFTPDLAIQTEDGKQYGGWMKHRILPYLLAFSILLFSLIHYSILYKRILIIITTAITFGLFSINIYYFQLVDKQLDEYFSGNHVYQKHATLLSITGKQGGYLPNGEPLTAYTYPFHHAASKISWQKELVYLENVEAKFYYYAIQYQRDKNPFDLLKSKNMVRPKMDLLAYEEQTGIPIDYISIWLGRKTIDPDTGKLEHNMAFLYQQLDTHTHYEKVFTSKNGLLEIYKRKKKNPIQLSASTIPKAAYISSYNFNFLTKPYLGFPSNMHPINNKFY